MMQCNLFADDPVLLCAPYKVRTPVSVDDFRQFVSALEDTDVEVTNANFRGLSLLCEEFRFAALSERLSTTLKCSCVSLRWSSVFRGTTLSLRRCDKKKAQWQRR
jgi:hypothetical protein